MHHGPHPRVTVGFTNGFSNSQGLVPAALTVGSEGKKTARNRPKRQQNKAIKKKGLEAQSAYVLMSGGDLGQLFCLLHSYLPQSLTYNLEIIIRSVHSNSVL